MIFFTIFMKNRIFTIFLKKITFSGFFFIECVSREKKWMSIKQKKTKTPRLIASCPTVHEISKTQKKYSKKIFLSWNFVSREMLSNWLKKKFQTSSAFLSEVVRNGRNNKILFEILYYIWNKRIMPWHCFKRVLIGSIEFWFPQYESYKSGMFSKPEAINWTENSSRHWNV